jgi:hypothetical protein
VVGFNGPSARGLRLAFHGARNGHINLDRQRQSPHSVQALNSRQIPPLGSILLTLQVVALFACGNTGGQTELKIRIVGVKPT